MRVLVWRYGYYEYRSYMHPRPPPRNVILCIQSVSNPILHLIHDLHVGIDPWISHVSRCPWHFPLLAFIIFVIEGKVVIFVAGDLQPPLRAPFSRVFTPYISIQIRIENGYDQCRAFRNCDFVQRFSISRQNGAMQG